MGTLDIGLRSQRSSGSWQNRMSIPNSSSSLVQNCHILQLQNRNHEPKNELHLLSLQEAILSQVRNGGSGGMGGGGGGARGGGGFGGGAMGAASGPTIARKRISRMSPGPEAQKKRPVIPPSNINGTDPVSVPETDKYGTWILISNVSRSSKSRNGQSICSAGCTPTWWW